jgi:hypothetical protein
MQISKTELTTPRGNIVGIGRVKIPKMLGFNYEIPLLSFVVLEKENGKFISSCIPLQMDGYGDSAENARVDMVNNIWYFLNKNFNDEKYKDKCWVSMYELSKANETSNDLWDKYHAVQYMLAEKGIAMDKHSVLEKKIKELRAQVEKLEKKNQELDQLLSVIMNNMFVEYEPATEVA